jgi:hypothetical protein
VQYGYTAFKGETRKSSAAARLLELRQPYDWGRIEQARAAIAAQLGQADDAVELLRDAVARGRLRVPHVHADPALQPLHSHPRFRQLLRPVD